MMQSQFVPDPRCNVPINPDLKCGEEWTTANDTTTSDDDDDFHHGPITFHITLPSKVHADDITLNFNCRDKSSGVLLPTEPTAAEPEEIDEDDHPNDPFFFERGYHLEAKTGFQPWPGTRLMVEAFTCNSMKKQGKNDRLEYWQTRLAKKDLTILEVGAGVGIVGACLAAAGGRVMVSDLPVLVQHSIWPNLKRNCVVVDDDESQPQNEHLDMLFHGAEEYCCRIGEGWAQAIVLDWFKPISEQLHHKASSSIDVIVACDCMFLRKVVDPLLNVVSNLFEQMKSPPKFLFTFQCRNMMGLFIGLEELLERIESRGWRVQCLAWRTISVEGDGEQDLHLFEVSPGTKSAEESIQEEKKENII